MLKYLSHIAIALSCIGLSHLYLQESNIDHLSEAIDTYKKFLQDPKNTDLETAFLPIDEQRLMFSGYQPKTPFEESMMHFIDVDFNESLRDIRNDFSINPDLCRSTFSNNIKQPEIVSFYRKFDIEVIYHELACDNFILESFLFLRKAQNNGYKTYKVTFSAKH